MNTGRWDYVEMIKHCLSVLAEKVLIVNDVATADSGVSSVPQDISSGSVLSDEGKIKYGLSLFWVCLFVGFFSVPWRIRNLCFKNNIVKSSACI